jgi:uncharacterized protein (DUF885 family)
MFTTRRAILGAGAAGVALLSGCASTETPSTPTPPASEGARLTGILDRVSIAILREQPERCTSLAISEAQAGGRYIDRVSDSSKAGARRYRGILQNTLNELGQLDRSRLNAQENVTVDVVSASFRNSVDASAFDVGGGAGSPYVVTQLNGIYRGQPNFLNEQHPLRTTDEADAFLARVEGFVGQMDQETAIIGEDAAAGVIPPDFVIDKALRQMTAFASTPPRQNVIVAALVRRLPDATAIPEASRAGYIDRAEALVRDRVLPAFQRQTEALQRIRPQAVHDAGVWRIPRGEEMYPVALRLRTTTTMTADEIHNLGVELVRQFNAETEVILRAQGLTRGSIAQRVQQISARPDQLYPNTDAGREQILADLNEQTRHIVSLMPQAFNTLARAQLEIKRVPPYTEAGAPGGYYQRGALDGSRAGAYFINLRDTREWPRFSLPTLNYHEGVPGHHWQISIQQESGSIPFIRSALLGFSAFSEGWGLYAEQLADELGVYADDPLGRLGYLQSATFRASRLVVDTGLHAKRWSREQAIQSMMEATGDAESSVTTEIERYCVNPGQACSYMVGRQGINRMRDASRQALGARFDLKRFHDTMLANGAVPLSVLDRIMSEWTVSQAA